MAHVTFSMYITHGQVCVMADTCRMWKWRSTSDNITHNPCGWWPSEELLLPSASHPSCALCSYSHLGSVCIMHIW